jgi:hypothetical protein
MRVLISIILALTIVSYLFTAFLFLGLSFFTYQVSLLSLTLLFLAFNYKSIINLKLLSIINNKLSFQELSILLATVLIFVLLFFNNTLRWGKWDAWAIWSLRSKFMIANSNFFNLFVDEIGWIHTDYPLMLPSLIASVWKSFSNTNPLIPVYVALIIVLLVLLLLFSSFLQNKSKRIFAFLILIVAGGTINLDLYGSYQYADTLLSLFFLVPVVLYSLSRSNLNISLCILIGFFAASTTWVKNEGIAFFIIFTILFIINEIKHKKNIIYFIIGATMPLLFLIYFKIAYAPANDLVDGTNAESLSKLVDWDRYVLVFDYLINFILQKFPFAFLLMIVAILVDYKYCKTIGFQAIIALFSTYFIIYILTPLGLEWHLKTSIDRLFHQTSPLILFSIFYYFASNYNLDIIKKIKY